MGARYTGIDGEAVARDYLTGIGARIVDSNVKTGGGEIDIIAMIDGVCVFVEVKTRTSTRFGRPSEAVTPAKMRKIIRAASMYAAKNHLLDKPLRFDVIELLPGEINHIPSAFSLSDVY